MTHSARQTFKEQKKKNTLPLHISLALTSSLTTAESLGEQQQEQNNSHFNLQQQERERAESATETPHAGNVGMEDEKTMSNGRLDIHANCEQPVTTQ